MATSWSLSWAAVPCQLGPPASAKGKGKGKIKGKLARDGAVNPRWLEDLTGHDLTLICAMPPTARTLDIATWMQRAVPYPLHIANDDEEVYGLGHWDANNMIFRCIVRCPNCHANFCNRRM